MGLEEWGVVEKELKRSRSVRVDWKQYFGESITAAVVRRLKIGYGVARTKKVLLGRLSDASQEVKRRFLISFSARVCEFERDTRQILTTTFKNSKSIKVLR